MTVCGDPDFTERTPEELSVGLLTTWILTDMKAGISPPALRCSAASDGT